MASSPSSLLLLPLILLVSLCVSAQSSQYISTYALTAIPSSLLYPDASASSSYGSVSPSATESFSSNTTSLQTSSSSTSAAVIGITGNAATPSASSNGTASTTSAASSPTNTQPCNGYAELCNRRLSNVSLVVAHNSPFVVAHNAASNQDLKVLQQLADGIRGLQFETHYVNDTLRLCHTSCNLLDVGTLEAYLTTVRGWLESNPYEVIAIMMGNDDRVDPSTYVAPFQNSGIIDYVWTPSNTSLTVEQWPTLAEMILTTKRVVVMLDYGADQETVPWLLDQFAYQWQTPFSPTDPAFPCTEQRPQGQSDEVSRDKMYMANHNLNVAISLTAGSETDAILIPAYSLLQDVNAVSGNMSLGHMVDNCTAMWGRPPNWLLVDYYNFGEPFNGSVFQVAATANNVTYNKDSCCGTSQSSDASSLFRRGGHRGHRHGWVETLAAGPITSRECLVLAILLVAFFM